MFDVLILLFVYFVILAKIAKIPTVFTNEIKKRHDCEKKKKKKEEEEKKKTHLTAIIADNSSYEFYTGKHSLSLNFFVFFLLFFLNYFFCLEHLSDAY